VKALATGVINERSKYRQEERREGGLLQFQDKQSVRMATRGDHLHYSKQKPGTEPQQNVYEQIDDPCRRPRPKTNSLNCPGFCAVGSKCGKLETDYSRLWVRLGGGRGLPLTVNSPPVAPSTRVE
jgi:hypothetical protein